MQVDHWEIMTRFCCELWANKCQGWEDVHSNTHGRICKGVLEATTSNFVIREHTCAQPTSNASIWF